MEADRDGGKGIAAAEVRFPALDCASMLLGRGLPSARSAKRAKKTASRSHEMQSLSCVVFYLTVTLIVAFSPKTEVTVMVAVPFFRALSLPVLSTVTIFLLLDFQVNFAPFVPDWLAFS